MELVKGLSDPEATDLANVLDVPQHQQRRFRHGGHAGDLWDWLERRDRLGDLPEALRTIDRKDLADLLEADQVAPPMHGMTEPPIHRSMSRPVIIAMVAIVGVLASGGAITAWALSGPSGQRGASAPPTTPPTQAYGHTSDREQGGTSIPHATGSLQARIARTWDVKQGKFIGTYVYSDPLPNRGTVVGSYANGDLVTIVCQFRHGRTIADDPWSDRQVSSPVWDRLAGPTPLWVPDMYVDIPKVSGETPPDDLPVCV